MMDRKTWGSLNDNTKKHWDCIEQDEKEKILNYAMNRASSLANSQNSGNRIGGFNLMNNNAKTTVNTHDMDTVDREFCSSLRITMTNWRLEYISWKHKLIWFAMEMTQHP